MEDNKDNNPNESNPNEPTTYFDLSRDELDLVLVFNKYRLKYEDDPQQQEIYQAKISYISNLLAQME